MNNIQLMLSLEEVNILLNALGNQPYTQIQPLIAKIQTQGSTQVQAAQNKQAAIPKTPVE
ncbi:MAG: hypothetical protein MK076_09735 [Flavobacteriales bacterium]|nr:hypothetical protein [Flavobacteriales bacterium]